MPATSMYFRNLKGIHSSSGARLGRAIRSNEADTIMQRNRRRRDLGFSTSRGWRSLNGSQIDDPHDDTEIELGGIRTFVHGSQHTEIARHGIQSSSSFRQYSETTESEGIQKARFPESP